jgi:ATP-dependent protease Clp ATPase subunit
MPKFIVERTVPRVGDLSPEKLKILSDLARTALQSFGGRVQWIESYVTEDKIFSILTAPDEATIRQYSKLTKLPADAIRLIKLVADVTTGEQI